MIHCKTRSFLIVVFCLVIFQAYLNASLMAKADDRTVNNEVNNPNSHPIFIYHPGPPKMATTTLQCSLSLLRPLLERNFFSYVGKVPSKFCPNYDNELMFPGLECLFDMNCQLHQTQSSKVLPNWHRLQYTLDEMHRQGKNIILSDETHSIFHSASEKMRHQFMKLFLSKNWRIHIVIGYRFYWQYWLSTRSELNRRLKRLSWQAAPLDSIYDQLQEEIQQPSLLLHTHSLIQYYRPYGNVTILNVNDELSNNVVKSFVCKHVLQQKPNDDECDFQVPHLQDDYNTAPDFRLAYIDQILYQVVHQLDWISNMTLQKHTRNKAVNLLFDLIAKDELGAWFLLECPTKAQLHILLQKSQQAEQDLMKYYLSRSTTHSHERLFWEAVARNSFCGVNVTGTLAIYGNKWQRLIQEA